MATNHVLHATQNLTLSVLSVRTLPPPLSLCPHPSPFRPIPHQPLSTVDGKRIQREASKWVSPGNARRSQTIVSSPPQRPGPMPDARGRGFYLSNGAEVSRSIAEDGLAPPLRAVLTEEEEGARAGGHAVAGGGGRGRG